MARQDTTDEKQPTTEQAPKQSSYSHERYMQHRETYVRAAKKYRNKPDVREKLASRSRQWRKDNPERTRLNTIRSRVRRFIVPTDEHLAEFTATPIDTAHYRRDLQSWRTRALAVLKEVERADGDLDLLLTSVAAIEPGSYTPKNECDDYYYQALGPARNYLGISTRGMTKVAITREFNNDPAQFAAKLREYVELVDQTLAKIK